MSGPPIPPYAPTVQYSPDGMWWWDGAGWRPTQPWNAGAPGAVAWAVPRQKPGFATGGVLALLGAVGMGVGSALAWASVTIGPFSASKSGIDGGDGWFFVGFAAIVVVLALIAVSGRSSLGIALPLVLIGLAAGALVGFEFNDAHNLITKVRGDSSNPFISDTAVSYGSGLYVIAAGVGAVLVGGALEWMRHARTRRPVT